MKPELGRQGQTRAANRSFGQARLNQAAKRQPVQGSPSFKHRRPLYTAATDRVPPQRPQRARHPLAQRMGDDHDKGCVSIGTRVNAPPPGGATQWPAGGYFQRDRRGGEPTVAGVTPDNRLLTNPAMSSISTNAIDAWG